MRNLSSVLESARHNDIKFGMSKSKPPSSLMRRKSRLPLIGEQYSSNYSPRSSFSHETNDANNTTTTTTTNTNSNSLAYERKPKSRISGSLKSKSKNDVSFKIRTLNIDSFLRKKNLEIINKPWHLTDNVLVKMRQKLLEQQLQQQQQQHAHHQQQQQLAQQQPNLLAQYQHQQQQLQLQLQIQQQQQTPMSFQEESIESVINKLKNVFRKKYGTLTSLPTFFNNNNNNNENISNALGAGAAFHHHNGAAMNRILFAGGSTTNAATAAAATAAVAAAGENRMHASIYLRKLKNNYYDRKLWYGVMGVRQPDLFNFFAEDTSREYYNEFDILENRSEQASDETVDNNNNNNNNKSTTRGSAKSLPCFPSSALLAESRNGALTQFQRMRLQKKDENKSEYLFDILKLIAVIINITI